MARNRVVTEEQRERMLAGVEQANSARDQSYENRFICGGYATWKGNELNWYVQPDGQDRENASGRTYHGTFEHAVKFGILPLLLESSAKSDCKRILQGYESAVAQIEASLKAHREAAA